MANLLFHNLASLGLLPSSAQTPHQPDFWALWILEPSLRSHSQTHSPDRHGRAERRIGLGEKQSALSY